jgi:hypothetical protein
VKSIRHQDEDTIPRKRYQDKIFRKVILAVIPNWAEAMAPQKVSWAVPSTTNWDDCQNPCIEAKLISHSGETDHPLKAKRHLVKHLP